MPTFTSYEHGTPCWVDMSSPDVEASKAFYTAVFGWDTSDETDDDGNYIYTMFSRGGQTVAGLGGQPPGMDMPTAVWNSYVSVDDADAALAKAEAAGGKIVMPAMDVMGAGRMGVIMDPTGAVLSVWQAADHHGAQVANEPDTWSWNELLSRDLEPALAFYAEVFGWSWQKMDMPTGEYHVIEGGEYNGLGGAMTMPDMMPDRVPNHWGVYFTVADAEATAKKITDNGGTITFGPQDTPGVGIIASAHDPQFGAFSIMQPAPAQEG